MKADFDSSWFNLTNYERLKKISIREWAYEIDTREGIYNLIVGNNNIHHDFLNYDINKTEDRLRIIEESILKLQRKSKVVEFDNVLIESLNDIIALEIAQNKKTASIQALTVWDIYHIIYLYTHKLKKYWKACKKIRNMDMSKNYDVAFSAIDNIAHQDNDRSFLSVSLMATDEQLIRDFSEWLKLKRKETNEKLPKKTFTQKDFKKWVDFHYLPYIDLILISKLQKIELTQKQIANLIFPSEIDYGDVDLTERVRKVVAPKAIGLITNNISSALHKQADTEQAKSLNME